MNENRIEPLIKALNDIHYEMLGSADALKGIADSCETLSQTRRHGWVGHLEQMIVSVSHRISNAANDVENLLDEAKGEQL